VAEQRGAERCQSHAAWQALEQLYAELLLEQLDALGQRRLRNVQISRGKRYVLALRDAQEIFKLSEVHRGPRPRRVSAFKPRREEALPLRDS